MNNIVIVDDCTTDFSITGIAKMLVTLEIYYSKDFNNVDMEHEFTLIVPTIETYNYNNTFEIIKKKFEKTLKMIKKKNRISQDINYCIKKAIIKNENLSEEVLINNANEIFSCVINENETQLKFLVDICFTNDDQENILNDNAVTSIYLAKKCYDEHLDCFVYTQYPPNQIVEMWNLKLQDIIGNDIARKNIYYRGDINGEARFNKSLADKLIENNEND